MIEIDGSYGEGGGQIVRIACGLSALTGKPFRIFNIRLKRKNPGLQPQHLNAVRAVGQLCNAEITGDTVGGAELRFKPNDFEEKFVRVNIGTAGSTILVLQALMIPATLGKVEAEITGGTDNPMAPGIDYLKNVTIPMLAKLGFESEVELIRRGHYPTGQGKIKFRSKGFQPNPINLELRGNLKKVYGLVHCTRLSENIAHRQSQAAKTILLNSNILDIKIDEEIDYNGTPGTGTTLWAECENSILGAASIGELGKRAEAVGAEASKELLEDLDTGMALDRHLADQIIPYIALTGGSVTVSRTTQHALTCAEICNMFLERKIVVEGEIGKPGRIFAK